MTRSDAKQNVQVHLDENSVDGNINSLDCIHVGLKTVLLLGRNSSVVPKVTSNCVGGIRAGTNYDINIGNRSPAFYSKSPWMVLSTMM